MTVKKNSGLRVLVDSEVASFVGKKLPKFTVEVQPFQTTTEASQENTGLVFAPKTRKEKRSVKDEFSARVRKFFETAVLSQLHEAALRDALKAPRRLVARLNRN